MTTLLIMVLCLFFAFAIYIAAKVARQSRHAEDYLDAGQALPTWAYIFAATGVVLAGVGLYDHFRLLALFGLQYNHVVVGLILVALTGALVQKRLWMAARITGLRTPGDLLGDYYDSAALRVFMLGLLFLFSVPFAATSLSQMGALIEASADGALPRPLAIWVTAFLLFLYSVIGGWRGVIFVVAAQTVLILTVLVFITGFSASTFGGLAFLGQGIVTQNGILPDAIPGVVQVSGGIGKGVTSGGIWTTTAIASFALGLTGIVLSPGFGYLTLTTRTRGGFAFNQVWMTGGLAAGLLLLLGPVIAAEMGGASYQGLLARLVSFDQLAAICLTLMLAASLQIAVSFLALSGANIVTLELVGRYVLPDLSGPGQRLAARIALAVIYLNIAGMASFAPLASAMAGSVTLSLSAQLLPALLGLAWVPWVSRSGVLTGLIVGILMVLFTEPLGLIAFEALFAELPWGRWPLTIHSAGWGLVFNFAACLLVSAFTKAGADRDHRDRLHAVFRRDHSADTGGRASGGAKWSLTLIWAFLALGPGAILGNTFFSQPVFSGVTVALGVPSVWVWQVVFWFLGVMIVWWLAYHGRMSVLDTEVQHPAPSVAARNPLDRRRPPRWIALFLARLAERQS